MTTATTTTEKPKTITLLPQVRDYLANWPTGEIRTMKQWNQATSHYHNVARLIDAGYLEVTDPANQKWVRWWDDAFQLRRTARPCRPFRGKGAKKKYRGIYPWGRDEHWIRLQDHSPMRVARRVAARLAGKKEWDLSMAQRRAMPVMITTASELTNIRNLLTVFFDGKDPMWGPETHGNMLRWMHHFDPPERVATLFSNGQGVRLLLLEMLVEPVFDVSGKVVRFRELDPDQAADEMRAIFGEGDTVKVKYLDYMGERAATTAP